MYVVEYKVGNLEGCTSYNRITGAQSLIRVLQRLEGFEHASIIKVTVESTYVNDRIGAAR